MRFASLGSGSRGNATLIESGDTLLILDCGFSVKETQRRLARLDIELDQLTAILVTHEHGDHINGVARLARKCQIPVWVSSGTRVCLPDQNIPIIREFNSHESFVIGGLQIQPFPVPHDAREPCQFVFSDDVLRLGVLTDVGEITRHICDCLDGCHGLLLECNYDPEMLRTGEYPPSLKKRVAGRFGHLSNEQAAGLLQQIDLQQLQHLVIAHISEKNNTPELAHQALESMMTGMLEKITVIHQDEGLGWHQLSRG
ncbi:MAG: MBL fold metallo-hydrolase [Gammaproteobacteria bacterium]|nr:MBL fold metallo-hydrolase [Gammaproteobacteria bacterium]